MKLLVWLPTLLLASLAAAATKADMLKDIDIINLYYKACTDKAKTKLWSRVSTCTNSLSIRVFESYTRLPHAERGTTSMSPDSCVAISQKLPESFGLGKSFYDFLGDKDIVCLAKDKKSAKSIKRDLEITLREWNEEYLPRFKANCQDETGRVFYIYQEYNQLKVALEGSISAWENWETTCASS